jgi:hypothetical protein
MRAGMLMEDARIIALNMALTKAGQMTVVGQFEN